MLEVHRPPWAFCGLSGPFWASLDLSGPLCSSLGLPGSLYSIVPPTTPPLPVLGSPGPPLSLPGQAWGRISPHGSKLLGSQLQALSGTATELLTFNSERMI